MGGDRKALLDQEEESYCADGLISELSCTGIYYVRDPMSVGVGQVDLCLAWWVVLY